jgi:hypothetical protein
MRWRCLAAATLLLVLAVVSCGRPSAAADESIDPYRVKGLIPAAAGMDAEAARIVQALGASVSWADMAVSGSTPLTSVLLALGAMPYVDPNRDPRCAAHFRCPLLGANTTPTDLLADLRPFTAGGSGHRLVSLLDGDSLGKVTCERAGDRASGTAAFSRSGTPPGGDKKGVLFEGSVEWSATQGPAGWRLDEFRLPACGIRVRLVGSSWKAEQGPSSGAPFVPLSMERHLVPTSDLTQLTSADPAPEDDDFPATWTIAVTADGRMSARGAVTSIRDLAALARITARTAGQANADGTSPGDVVIRVASAAPWSVVDTLLRVCAQAKFRRMFFAVRHAKGEGVLPYLFPLDRGMSSPSAESRPLSLRLAPHARPIDATTLANELRSRLAAGGRGVTVEVVPGVASGSVLPVVDAAGRAGARDIAFRSPDAERRAGWLRDEGWTPERIAKEEPVTASGLSVEIEGVPVAPSEGGGAGGR